MKESFEEYTPETIREMQIDKVKAELKDWECSNCSCTNYENFNNPSCSDCGLDIVCQ